MSCIDKKAAMEARAESALRTEERPSNDKEDPS